MRSLNGLSKLLSRSYNMFFLVISCLITYFFYLVYLSYNNYDKIRLFYYLLTIICCVIYLSHIGKLKNRIEMIFYKEKYEQTIMPLVIQAILYGVITPFSLINYYVIYILINNGDSDFFKKIVRKENKYYLAYIFINLGFIIYLLYLSVSYLLLVFDVRNHLLSQNYQVFSMLLRFLILILWLILIRVGIKFFKEDKFIECCIVCLIVGMLSNPFNIHSICLLTSGFIILSKDNNYQKLKVKIKDKWFKK